MKKHSLLGIFLSLVLILGGCSDHKVQLPALSDDAVILAFGDSLTYGAGVSPDKSYPSQLQRLIKKTVINGGISGEITENGLKRLPALLEQHQPELLILIHGGNDLLRQQSIDNMKQNLIQMIQLAKAQDISIVMLSVPSFRVLLSAHPVYEEIAELENIPIDTSALPKILQYPRNKSDQIHPNAKGYLMMADSIQQLLIESGALPAD